MCAEFLIENNKNSIVSDCEAIEQSICVMPISKFITNDNLGVKKYCINEKKVLGKILYIWSWLLKISGVKKIIALSTDKAVYPINAMGISKAMMERLVASKGRNVKDTIIICTRYGNVMASRGSVIPLFINQIKNGNPLTITDPNMTRFMMSLDQAVDLVLFAFENAESGDIFVQKAPAATIKMLAKSIVKIFGKPNHEIKIIGTRHGEKLYETLLTKEEMVKAIDMDDYYRIPADNRDLNYNKFFEEGEEIITQAGEYHSHNTHRLDEDELTNLLLELKEIQDDLEGFGTCE